jgi:hypothetical protein
LIWFTKTQLFEVFITQKSTPNVHFGLIFDEAVEKWEAKRAAKNSNNVENSTKVKTVRQISKLKSIFLIAELIFEYFFVSRK